MLEYSSKMHKVKQQEEKGWIYNYRWIFQYPFKIFHRITKKYKDINDLNEMVNQFYQSVILIYQEAVENMHIFIAHETFTKTDQTLK